MTSADLQEILRLHKLWLDNAAEGICANLRDANLCGADLRNADLSDADLCGVDLHDVNLRGADLRGANLVRADLSGTDLRGANLLLASLFHADLSGANLSEANLHCTNLSGANLSGANLSGANLIGANLSGSNLSGVGGVIFAGTPDGWTTFGWLNASVLNIRVGCQNLAGEQAREYWAEKQDRREVLAAVDYIQSIAKIRGWTK